MAVLARDGYHGVRPVFDDRRRPEPDLLTPAPPNRWRNPGDKQLWMLYRAAWRLGDHAPASLLALRRTMLSAVSGTPAAQAAALGAFDERIGGVLDDIRACRANEKAVALAARDIDKAVSLRAPPADR
jgi:hypothetical protein